MLYKTTANPPIQCIKNAAQKRQHGFITELIQNPKAGQSAILQIIVKKFFVIGKLGEEVPELPQ